MGLISDWFVATEDEVGLAEFDGRTGERFPAVEMKNVDDVKLATLEELLTGTAYATIVRGYDTRTSTSVRRRASFACDASSRRRSRRRTTNGCTTPFAHGRRRTNGASTAYARATPTSSWS
jgi:hypothetical protein